MHSRTEFFLLNYAFQLMLITYFVLRFTFPVQIQHCNTDESAIKFVQNYNNAFKN